jgi:hypothetical protein
MLLKRPCGELSLRKRCYGSTAIDETKQFQAQKILKTVSTLIVLCESDEESDEDFLENMYIDLLKYIMENSLAHPDSLLPLPKIENKHLTIANLCDNDIPANFRFKDKNQLNSLLIGLKFHEIYIEGPSYFKYTGEEILLAGLFRMHSINVFGDESWTSLFGWSQPRASVAFNHFLNHMQAYYYLIESNIQFWTKYLKQFSESVTEKLRSFNVDVGSCTVFGFIDNTTFSTCRPGGGPTKDGERHNPLMQQAFYNGYKSLHGLKVQTVDLPNGMNYHIHGVVSLRHNDLYTYNESNINEKIAECQVGSPIQYSVYGDSAYKHLNDSHIKYRYPAEGNLAVILKRLSSCRETVEWNYGHLKQLFKILDNSKTMKIRQQRMEDIIKSCMVMRNLYVTMNGCNTSKYFNCMPPSFAEYLSIV